MAHRKGRNVEETIAYTDPEKVTDVEVTPTPKGGQTVTGYGGAIPTAHKIKYLEIWRRVYAMAYGNAATLYVKVKGEIVALDSDTAHLLRDAD